MDIRQLQYFVAVAEELHFGRAAERLGMAQPPLSRQIKQIEADLGALLFNRGRSAITLTQAGERLYERGAHLLAEFHDIQLEVRRIGEGAEGQLRIGFVGSATYGVLPGILKAFRATYPDVSLSLIPMNNAQLHRALVRRSIDIAVARPALEDAEIVSRSLESEPLAVAVPEMLDFPRDTVRLEALADQRFILYPEYPRPSFADFVINACATAGVGLNKRVFTMDLQTAIALVSVGEGVAIVPNSVSSVRRDTVRFHAIANTLPLTSVSVNHRIDEQGVHVRNFVSVALKVVRKAP